MRRHQVQLVDLAVEIQVELDLDRADHLFQRRPVAEVRRVRNDVGLEALHEAKALAADGCDSDADTFGLPILDLRQRHAQGIGVEPAAESFVGRDDDQPDIGHRGALHQERMPVFGVGERQMPGDGQHAADVGTRGTHPILRPFHLRGRDHLHRLGDLARALHALDLVANLFRAGHRRDSYQVPFFLKSSIVAASAFSPSASRSFVDSIFSKSALYLLFTNVRRLLSNASAFSTGTSS